MLLFQFQCTAGKNLQVALDSDIQGGKKNKTLTRSDSAGLESHFLSNFSFLVPRLFFCVLQVPSGIFSLRVKFLTILFPLTVPLLEKTSHPLQN